MITKTIYICSNCGQAFDCYTDCYEHEMREVAEKYSNVKFYDEKGRQLPLDVDPSRIDYIETDAAGAKYVDKYFSDTGFDMPGEDVDISKGGRFYWDGDYWCSVDNLRNRLAEIESVFKDN